MLTLRPVFVALLLSVCNLFACGSAPLYTTTQGIEVYGDDVGQWTHLSSSIDMANGLILNHLAVNPTKYKNYQKDTLSLFVFTNQEDIADICQSNTAVGCFDANREFIAIFVPEPCKFYILTHELLHLAHYLKNGDPDINHLDPEFGFGVGTIVDQVRQFLSLSCP